MVMALVIVAVILYLIFISKEKFKLVKFDPVFKNILIFATLLTLVQIVLGTQVSQHVDEQVKAIGYIKSMWLDNPTLDFYIHRTLSILVLAVNFFFYYTDNTQIYTLSLHDALPI